LGACLLRVCSLQAEQWKKDKKQGKENTGDSSHIRFLPPKSKDENSQGQVSWLAGHAILDILQCTNIYVRKARNAYDAVFLPSPDGFCSSFIYIFSIGSLSNRSRTKVLRPVDQPRLTKRAIIMIALLALTSATLHNIDIAGLQLYQLTVAGAATVFHRLPFSAARRRRTYGTHELRLFYYTGRNEKRPKLGAMCSIRKT